MSMANRTHPIDAYTFNDTNVHNLGEVILSLPPAAGYGTCVWWGVQNQTGDFILILPSASATKGMKIENGDTYRTPIDPNGNGYDVFEYWIKSNAGAGDLIVERKIG